MSKDKQTPSLPLQRWEINPGYRLMVLGIPRIEKKKNPCCEGASCQKSQIFVKLAFVNFISVKFYLDFNCVLFVYLMCC
jgi:hypothetical protein